MIRAHGVALRKQDQKILAAGVRDGTLAEPVVLAEILRQAEVFGSG
jgi:hypothetical protein